MPDEAERGTRRARGRIGIDEPKLRALLDRDCKEGTIVAARDNKINRRHYAQLLGCTHSNLVRFTGVFAEYERAFDVVTGPTRHLADMRKWLTDAFEACELETRDNRVDRIAFETRFGLRGGTFVTRHQDIRALLEEFDARVVNEAYLPKARQLELGRVATVLTEHSLLNKDRLTINLVELARVSDVPKIRFSEGKFAELIANRTATIRLKAEANELDPLVHGRVFPFSNLCDVWPQNFLQRIGGRFKKTAPSLAKETVKSAHLSLTDALAWIGASSNESCLATVAEANEHDRILSGDHWEDALFAYRDHLVSSIKSHAATEASVDTAIARLRASLQLLSPGGPVPETSIPLFGVKYSRRRRGHLRSVAEATSALPGEAPQDYVEFARQFFGKIEISTELGFEQDDVEAFLAALGSELTSSKVLPADPASAIRAVLERRLEVLRTHAWRIIEEGMSAYERGIDLLNNSDIDASYFETEYLKPPADMHKRRQWVRNLFPSRKGAGEQQADRGLANLLRVVVDKFGGIPPLGGGYAPGPYGQFFAKRYLEHGGVEAIVPLLTPSPHACGAVLTAYLADSGANVSVGRTLERNCSEPSEVPGHVRVTGHKARAGGKPIIVDLPLESSSVKGIHWLASVSARLEAAATEDSDRLLLMRIGGRVQLMTPHWYTDWFKKFAASIPGLESTLLVPSMLRPSVLLLAALKNEGRLQTGMAIAQHGRVVSQGYQQKWPTRILYDDNMRRFLAAFEVLVASNVDNAASKMGLSQEEFEARLHALRPTGLGTFCKDPRGRPGEQGNSCSTLDCWNDCPHLAIIAEVEAVAMLQLWQRSLRNCQPEWERDHIERWDKVWLPWLCLTDAVEEKMARGPMLKTWNEAKARALQIAAQPNYVPPKPW